MLGKTLGTLAAGALMLGGAQLYTAQNKVPEVLILYFVTQILQKASHPGPQGETCKMLESERFYAVWDFLVWMVPKTIGYVWRCTKTCSIP
eukprot:m.127292 g.127292  ORF g.127292 m.127292 type:complete len:91 (-) comp14542_c0_seq3:2196-2468(-)